MHVDAAPRRAAHLAQQAVAREEVGVGDDHLPARAANRGAIVALDVVAVLVVVANHEQGLRSAGRRRRHGGGRARRPGRRGAAGSPRPRSDGCRWTIGPSQLDRIVLLRLRPEVGQVIGREVDAADERDGAVDDDQLAVHAPQHVRAHAQDPGRRIEAAQPHPGLGERRLERRREVGRSRSRRPARRPGRRAAPPRSAPHAVRGRPCPRRR